MRLIVPPSHTKEMVFTIVFINTAAFGPRHVSKPVVYRIDYRECRFLSEARGNTKETNCYLKEK